MLGGDGEADAVVPNLPAASIVLQGLLGTGQRLFHAVGYRVTVCNVSPGLGLRLINTDDVSKRENRLVELLKSHVGASTGEPLTRVKLVDLE